MAQISTITKVKYDNKRNKITAISKVNEHHYQN